MTITYKTKLLAYSKHFHISVQRWPVLQRVRLRPTFSRGFIALSVALLHHSLLVSWSKVSYL